MNLGTDKKINTEDFENLYRKYAGGALRLAAAVLGDKDSADDAVQEAFIRVYRSLEKFDSSRDFKPWFDRILINECRRIASVRLQYVDIDDVEKIGGLSYSTDDDEIEALKGAISRLKPKYRELILLKYMQGYTESEIAKIVSLPRSTVKSRLFEARNEIKCILKEDYHDEKQQ